MSQIDLNLIGRIVRDKDLRTVWNKGVSSELVSGSAEREIFLYLEEHYKKYSEVPSVNIIEQRFGLEVPNPNEGIEYWLDEILNRTLFGNLADASDEINRLMQERKPREALNKMRQFITGAGSRGDSGRVHIENIFALVDVVKQKYEDAKLGKMGIPTPWPSMDEVTMGWWPEDVSYFVARPGVGKTWCAALTAVAAWRAGKRVRLISCEMSREDVAMRIMSIITKVQYGAIRRGRLGLSENIFFAELDKLRSSEGIDIVDCRQGMTSMDIDLAFDDGKAELGVIDAAYRIKAGGKVRDRFENMALVTDDMKATSQRHRIPIVATTQLNRSSTKNKDGGTEDIALSDAIGWNGTNIFKLEQNKEQYENRVMHIRKLKTREGENNGKPIQINWDMVNMDFSEISDVMPSVNRKAWKDDDF